MSLFPAYSTETKDNTIPETSANLNWLKNVSFTSEAVHDSLLFPAFKVDDERITEGSSTKSDISSTDTTKGTSIKVDDYKSKHQKKLNKRKKGESIDKAPERKLEVGPPKKIFIEQLDRLSFQQTFRIDKKCDRTNLAFTSFAPVQIAKYVRKKPFTGDDSLRNGSNRKNLIKRYFNYTNKSKEDLATLDYSVPKLPWDTFGVYFIPITIPDSQEDGTCKEEKSEKSSSDKTLHQRLRENPHDYRLWLEFVKFQSDSVDAKSFISSDTPESRREKMIESVVTERKLAILERAIESNPKAVELMLYKFNLCKDVWDTDQLGSEWKKQLFIHPNNTLLWHHYLLFYQTKFSTFTVSKFIKLAGKCFSTLRKILEGTFQSHRVLPHMEEHVISIFSNYCNMLYQSGYQEKAVASYQALIEFNFFAPEQFSSSSTVSLEDRLAFFEPFWDSGVPRFGEENSPGWSATMKNKEFNFALAATNSSEEEDSAIRPSELKWRNWLRLERVRCKNNWFPWLPNDGEESCDDSERMVFLDDVMPTLFQVKEIQNRFLLIVQFLKLLGVGDAAVNMNCTCETLQRGFNGNAADICDVINVDRCFKWRFYELSRTLDSIPLERSVIRAEKLDKVINTIFENAQNLFKDHLKYRRLITLFWIRWKASKIDFKSSDDQDRRNRIREVKRFIKNLLKLEENRNDYDLWVEHCLFEIKCGNIAEARKVFDLLTSTHESWDRLTPYDKSSVCNIYSKYAICEMNAEYSLDESTRARLLCLLTTLSESRTSAVKTSPSPAAILKARLRYKNLVEQQITFEIENEGIEERWCLHYTLVSTVTCYSIFEYLTAGLKEAEHIIINVLQSLEEGMKPWNDVLEEWQTPSKIRRYAILEGVYKLWLQLQVVHSNNEPSAPVRLLRNVLDRALRMFPSNVYFNHLFLDIEGKSHLRMRLRNYYDIRLKESSSADLMSAVFAIVGEMERMRNIIYSRDDSDVSTHETGITQRLRALLEKCVKHSQLCHSVLIWRLYLKFEGMQGHLKNCKAVFYRALQQCPWAKIIYMDAVQLFPEDLQELHDLMAEKEIRIMAPLEEVALLMDLQRKSDQPPNPETSDHDSAI